MEKMTCKDCIHYDVCGFNEYINFNEICSNFKDKSRIIESPCKIGDTVYYLDDIVDNNSCTSCENYYESGICNYPICKKTLYGFRPAKCIKIIEIIANKDFIFNQYDKFGEKIFLTKEEAEAKLKELN